MCGIAGIVSEAPLAAVRAFAIARAMNDSLRHRGPDGAGVTLVDGAHHHLTRWDAAGAVVERGGKALETVSVALGHRRLAIRDVEGGAQPMSDRAGQVFITFNGEIYNCDELWPELRGRGATFRGHSDTEVILEAYLAWGPACVERLDGMFAFAIWDARHRQLLLARDRLGIKPLLVAHVPGALVFASELKGLLASGLVAREVRPEAVNRYLHHLYVPPPEGPLRQVEIVGAGHLLIQTPSGLDRRRYWQVAFEPEVRRSSAYWIEEFRDAVTKAVRSHLVSDVPVGAFLSGGLDSSVIVALMAEAVRPSGKRVLTSTVGFDVPEYDESDDARVVAGHVGTDHREVRVTGAAVEDVILDVLGHYDQPFADSSAVPTFLLCRAAAREVKVALAGDGADELLAGYARLRQYAVLEALRHAPRTARLAGATASLAGHVLAGRRARQARNLAAYVRSLDHDSRRDAMDAYVYLRDVFRDGWRERLLSEGFRRAVEDDDVAPHIRRVASESRALDPLSRLLHVELMTYLPNDILQKVDMASMAFGLEVRVPFLDHHVVELVARMPLREKLTPFRQKAVMREAFAPLLPRRTLRKRKQGFHLPVDAWFRGPAGGRLLDEVLLAPRSLARGYFERSAVETLIREHRAGAAEHGARLWTLLQLEIWHRRYIDVPAAFP